MDINQIGTVISLVDMVIKIKNKYINDAEVNDQIKNAMWNALEKTCQQHDMECDYQILENYIGNNTTDKIFDLLFMDGDDIKKILFKAPEVIGQNICAAMEGFKESLENIDEKWIYDWRNNCCEYLSENSETSNYLLLKIILEERLQQKMREDAQYADIKAMAKLINDDIDKSRRKNMYDNLTMLNRSLYPFLEKKLTLESSDMLIDIAYALTDIYDHVSEYEKSEKLCDLIREVIIHKNKFFSVKQLRILTGCAYSITIAKVNDIVKKERLLDKAKNQFDFIKENMENCKVYDNNEWNEFQGMFESDYGAWYTNKGDLEKNRNKRLAREYYENALKHQQKGECYRKKLCDLLAIAEEDFSEQERTLYQSKSNIAGLLYRMGMYDEAIDKHKEVLEYREREKKISDSYLSREYIAGAYLEKWKRGNISDIEKEECKNMLTLCQDYYNSTGDINRLENIERKWNAINKLEEKF